MTPQRYRKRPVEVEAMQLTADNAPEVVTWCGGWIQTYAGTPYTVRISWNQRPVLVGDFTLKLPDGTFSRKTAEEMARDYEAVTDEEGGA